LKKYKKEQELLLLIMGSSASTESGRGRVVGKAKLYYTPTSCGAASFIAAHIAGLQWEAEQVTFNDHKTTSGEDFYAINPKGNVPTLVLADGTVLVEGSVVLQYIADQVPGALAPRNGEEDRYLVQQSLNHTASEIHTAIGSLLNPDHTDETRAFQAKLIERRLTYLENHVVKGRQFVVGNSLTIADLYLYIVLTWAPYVKVELSPYPSIQAYFEGIKNHPGVLSGHAQISSSPSQTN
jgi:glutathione S-transferase